MSMGHQKQLMIDVKENKVPWSPLSDVSTGSCDSSSSFSWTDETDLSIAKELEEQFKKFEEALYLEASPTDLPQSLQDEVKLWAEYSPHIRIRGIQAKLNKQSENNEKGTIDHYDANYEEVIAFHESLESFDKIVSLTSDINDCYTSSTKETAVREDLKNEMVNELLEKTWPEILEEVVPVIKSISAGKTKAVVKDPEKLQTSLGAIKNQKALSRSNSSRSYLRDVSPRKLNPDCGSEYSCLLSSRGVRPQNFTFSNEPLSVRELHRVPRTCLPKTRINRVSTFSAKLPDNSYLNRSKATPLIYNKKTKTYITEKSVILPPIEALAITPKKPDKRANSAMVRFTKTLPRIRPSTSKKKHIGAVSLSTGNQEIKNGTDNIIGESVHHITLEVIGTKSNTANRKSQWRH